MIGKRVLFLGCHMDDVEFGCGGIIQDLKHRKDTTLFLDVLSDHNENAANELQLQRKMEEMDLAMKILGCDREDYHVGKIAGQRFDSYQQKIREYLLELRDNYCPDTVFFPAMRDVHQDHKTLAQESFRIFRGSSCLGYEVIRSTKEFVPNLYYEMTEDQIERKCEAVMAYKSQLIESSAYYFNRALIRSTAVYRGGFSGMSLAEAFEIYIINIREK